MRRLESLAAASPTLQAYLQEIAKYPRLAVEQERELGRRIRQRDEDARHALVESNLRFVASYARRYRGLGVPVLELIHEGNLGLFEAAAHFDPDRHVRFITHALWWVRQGILRRLSERHAAALGAAVDHLSAQEGGAAAEPWNDEAFNVQFAPDDGRFDRLIPLRRDEDVDALVEALGEQTLRELDDPATRDALMRELEGVLEMLDPRERQAMRARYGLPEQAPFVLRARGRRVRGSNPRVTRLESQAIQKLRQRQHLRGALN